MSFSRGLGPSFVFRQLLEVIYLRKVRPDGIVVDVGVGLIGAFEVLRLNEYNRCIFEDRVTNFQANFTDSARLGCCYHVFHF